MNKEVLITSLDPYVVPFNYSWRHYSNGTLVLNMLNGGAYHLNKTAGDIWKKVRDGLSNEEIIQQYCSEYGVGRPQFSREFSELILHLHAIGLICLDNVSNTKGHSFDSMSCTSDKGASEEIRTILIEKLQLTDPFPFKANLEINRLCNLKCIHCIDKEDSTLSYQPSIAQIESTLQQLAELGTFSLEISGGEPFYRKDCLDILKLARSMGFKLSLVTNATLLDSKMIAELASINIASVHVSLHAITPDIHDKFVGVKGAHRKALSAIDLLDSRGIKVVIHSSITKFNSSEQAALYDYYSRKGFSYKMSILMFPTYTGDKFPCSLMLEAESLKKAVELKLLEEGLPVSTLLCDAGKTRVFISARGDVYPCIMLRTAAGSIHENNLRDIWEKSKLFERIRSIKEEEYVDCIDCKSRKYCEGFCIGLNYLYNDDMLKYPDYICNYANTINTIVSG